MSNFGATVAKAAMLAGGAVLGMLLARVFDEWMVSHSHTQSDYDKMRYAQGLGALELPPAGPVQAPFQEPNPEQEQYQDDK